MTYNVFSGTLNPTQSVDREQMELLEEALWTGLKGTGRDVCNEVLCFHVHCYCMTVGEIELLGHDAFWQDLKVHLFDFWVS